MTRLVVVSNRVPLPSTGLKAGGLAVALDGLMEKRGGLWFGWSGGIAPGPCAALARVESATGIDYATIDLTQDEHDRYYNNFCNGVLWPLLHTMPELMKYDRRDARAYREVNGRFAASLMPLLRPTDMIWVHDYHLMALPACLRARGVRCPIGFFLHIPFAAPDVIASAPELGTLVKDMLAADLIGFQTENDLANFAAAAHDHAGAVRVSTTTLQYQGRRIRLGVFPVEIEAPSFARTAARMVHSAGGERLKRSLDGQLLVLGIDRLDPTKGLMQRLAGLRCLLERHEGWRRKITLLQIAAESRKDVSSYRALRAALDAEAGAINADLGAPDWQPLRLISRTTDRAAIAGYMRLARVGLVTPLRDGMNLVAKEFVAAQDPEDPGVLILSRFAGAAHQLTDALLVNPHDPDAMADAIDTALRMELDERRERWRKLWKAIENRTPTLWGRSFLATLMRTTLPVIRPMRRQALAFAPAEVLAAAPHLTLVASDRDDDAAPRRLN
jgi:trehalose 6-phosphate synthase